MINETNKLIKKIYYKPKKAIFIIIIIGILFIITLKMKFIIVGCLLIAFSLWLLLYNKNDLVLNIYDNGLHLIQKDKIILWQEINTWVCTNGESGADYIEIILQDQSKETITTFNANTIASILWKMIPEKEKKNQSLKKIKEQQPKGKWSLWAKTIIGKR